MNTMNYIASSQLHSAEISHFCAAMNTMNCTPEFIAEKNPMFSSYEAVNTMNSPTGREGAVHSAPSYPWGGAAQ